MLHLTEDLNRFIGGRKYKICPLSTNTIFSGQNTMNGIEVQNVKILREGKETNSYRLKSISCQLYRNKAGIKSLSLLQKTSGSLKNGYGFTRQSWVGR